MPLPGTRSVCPSSMPAGTLMLTVSCLRSTPPPLHSGHLSLTVRPRPRQVGQVVAIMKMPWLCATWPRPPQVLHATGCDPALAPEPLHSAQ